MPRLITLLLLAIVLCGCASMEERKKTVTLDKATTHYENAIRWGDYEDANAFRRQEGPDTRTPDPAALKRFRVTSYEFQSTTMNEEETEAWIVVKIGYYDEDRMREVTLTDRQTWKYDTDLEQWFLASPLPAFR
jgi:hypothetical protein